MIESARQALAFAQGRDDHGCTVHVPNEIEVKVICGERDGTGHAILNCALSIPRAVETHQGAFSKSEIRPTEVLTKYQMGQRAACD